MAISQVFTCDRCGAQAGRVALYARGEVIPGRTRHEIDSVTSAMDNSGAERARVQVESDVVNVTMFEFDVAATLSALSVGDARALHKLDLEFVPFWCPPCDAAFCGRHWVTWDLFDDGFFDEKRGRCPAGHERRLFD